MASAKDPLLEDPVAFGDDLVNHEEIVKKFSHPYVILIHVFFRFTAMASYLFCDWFNDSFITCFVIVVLLLSIDFWAVKNLTGRLLVGLRWWNYVDDKGVSHWIYETKSENYATMLNLREVRIFWIALVTCPVIWAFLFIVALFGFNFRWLLLVLIAFVLNGANLYGYLRCNFGGNISVRTTAADLVKTQILKNAVNLMSA